ncbi:hypothetical protein QJU11_09955 [Pasteurella atlantica]|uniref:hypothetical protein n=1 Tax=Phocoenobacter atlanticus TaxID=3416742 RepID=UPI00275119EC|nr:hypothetical protein [Pasteurella atlantica]MDP8042514.1 hypothetical protein [Pasteurella atlantica]
MQDRKEREINKNEIFKNLLFLTDLVYDQKFLIKLLHKNGIKNITGSKIRKWRSSFDSLQAQPVPQEVLIILFDYLFSLKKIDSDLFTIPNKYKIN